jgi:hypothetical protein
MPMSHVAVKPQIKGSKDGTMSDPQILHARALALQMSFPQGLGYVKGERMLAGVRMFA